MDDTSVTNYADTNNMGTNGVFVCSTQWCDDEIIDGRKHTDGTTRRK